LHPIASALLGWPVLGERIGWLEAVSLLFCAGGTLLVVQPAFIFDSMPPRAHESSTDGSKGMGYTLGVITQLCSALFAAGAMMAVRYLGKKKPCPSVLAIALWFHGVSSLTGAFVLALPVGQSPSIPSWRNAALLIAIACTSFIGQYLLTVSYAKLRVAVAGGLSYLQVAFSFIVGVTILDEALNVKKVSGAVSISIGGVLVSYAKQRREQKQKQQQHQQHLPTENNRASESKQLNGVSFGDSNSVQQGEKQSGGSIELQEQKDAVQADSPYEEDYPTNAAGPKKREIALREEASLHER
jgi:drug/metabolite transporter (DMT)-like permease